MPTSQPIKVGHWLIQEECRRLLRCNEAELAQLEATIREVSTRPVFDGKILCQQHVPSFDPSGKYRAQFWNIVSNSEPMYRELFSGERYEEKPENWAQVVHRVKAVLFKNGTKPVARTSTRQEAMAPDMLTPPADKGKADRTTIGKDRARRSLSSTEQKVTRTIHVIDLEDESGDESEHIPGESQLRPEDDIVFSCRKKRSRSGTLRRAYPARQSSMMEEVEPILLSDVAIGDNDVKSMTPKLTTPESSRGLEDGHEHSMKPCSMTALSGESGAGTPGAVTCETDVAATIEDLCQEKLLRRKEELESTFKERVSEAVTIDRAETIAKYERLLEEEKAKIEARVQNEVAAQLKEKKVIWMAEVVQRLQGIN